MKLIKGSVTDYITEDGRVYKNKDKQIFQKSVYLNPYNGYCYCGITYEGRDSNLSKRVHRLVAEAFIDNPTNLPIVGHKNNIKSDNRVENLYWTTVSENTKKAYEDKLANGAKGEEDSQSKAIKCLFCGELYGIYGSIREASRELNIPLSTIHRRLGDKEGVEYRKYKDYKFEYIFSPSLVVTSGMKARQRK